MLDAKKIKAARALLDWNQQTLSQKSGLSIPAIANIERGAAKPRQDTLELIQQTFEQNGIEFIEPYGVQFVGDKFSMKMWSGHDSQFKIWADMFKEFSDGNGGEILMSGISDRPAVDRYPKEIAAFVRRRIDMKIDLRLLFCEDDSEIIGADPTIYRQIPKVLFAQTPHYIYKNKVALLQWDIQRVILLENKALAETFRQQFNYNWSIAKPLTTFTQIL
ncbi:MAG: helix-turn-helix domain-containing protein [Alphaproteobacteria bacterium]|nr:helix-turn-helix domain-containing protein [Alphaproteobacteria bacterium]